MYGHMDKHRAPTETASIRPIGICNRSAVLRMPSILALLPLAALLLASTAKADDIPIYVDGNFAAGWENWSWGSDINFAATDLFEGSSSMFVNSTAFSALSLKLEGTFGDHAGLRFDIAGDKPDLTITIQASDGSATSPNIVLSTINPNIAPNAFTSILIDFSNLPGSGTALGPGTWDRLAFQAGFNGAAYHIDNVVIVQEIVVTPLFLSAEPIAANTIAVTTQGAVDFSTIKVSLNGKNTKITNTTTTVPAGAPSKSVTYLTLDTLFAPGTLLIDTGVANGGKKTFNFTLPAVQFVSIVPKVNYPISPQIYGVNFPASTQYIKDLGIGMSRWGGNAVTAYNPNGHFTNAGNDWFFENRVADPPDADAWISMARSGGSGTFLTIPALDWVAKDATSYSYPMSVYPDSVSQDPFNADAGNGHLANGSAVTPTPDQTRAYTAWNMNMAKTWLAGLANKPDIVMVDNEIEIASSTHQDMHPEPVDYDEELARVINTAIAAKAAIPGIKVAAPSTCAWWFYWTSVVGFDDNAAHDNIDFIPWFLTQMAKAEKTNGKRLLDYLDIHYYFQGDTSANDAAAKALRLRMTRSLWDTTYVDESWVGVEPQQNHQWNPTIISLIPRFRTLIDINYPGTKLSISEWNSQADGDLTGGLHTADMLGIFGREKLDAATYWGTSDESGPIGTAFWLYRGYFSPAQVNLATPLPNTQGFYAGTDLKTNKISLVIVNKNPDKPIAFQISNMPAGSYFMRHFGGQAGVAKWQTTVLVKDINYVVVPAYTAVFFKQN
ncbi:Glycoside hydrolase family 44 protein [Mycena kentingensis (nom. inval.)]|nr:Glycoside hydrolase family 44 protein [Mycena kentingensis (nom. inval.)]